MAYNPRGVQLAPRADTSMMPDCDFYLAGSCLKGNACPFKHDPVRLATQKQQLCKFFNSPTGCFRGDACIYKHVQVRHGLKVVEAPIEARINAALGAGPRLIAPFPGADDFHIELDQQTAQDPLPRVANAARQRALGREAAVGPEVQVQNGVTAQRLPLGSWGRSAPTGDLHLPSALRQPLPARQGPDATAEGPLTRNREPALLAPQLERPAKEPVIKRLSQRSGDPGVEPTKSVFRRLGLLKGETAEDPARSAAALRARPRRSTVASTVQVASVNTLPNEVSKKRKVDVVDESPDEEGELMQPERTVRVAAVATKQRQPSDGERQPVRTRLSAGDGTAGPQQPRASVKGRLSRPAAGQAPLQAPPQAATGVTAPSATRPAAPARLSARATNATQPDAAASPKTLPPSAPTSSRLNPKLDAPLADRTPRSTAARAPPVVKTLQELRMERERSKQHHEQRQQPETKRQRDDARSSESSVQVKQTAASAARPVPIQRQRSAGKAPADQVEEPRQPTADANPVSRTAKAVTPRAAEHADDFDWEADIDDDEIGQGDVTSGHAMDEVVDDDTVVVEEQDVDLDGEEVTDAAAQQDDFAKRMAAFADAFD